MVAGEGDAQGTSRKSVRCGFISFERSNIDPPMPMLKSCSFPACNTRTLTTFCLEHEVLTGAQAHADRAQAAGACDEPQSPSTQKKARRRGPKNGRYRARTSDPGLFERRSQEPSDGLDRRPPPYHQVLGRCRRLPAVAKGLVERLARTAVLAPLAIVRVPFAPQVLHRWGWVRGFAATAGAMTVRQAGRIKVGCRLFASGVRTLAQPTVPHYEELGNSCVISQV